MIDGGNTSPTLLRRLENWGDQAAWLEFVGRYEPLVLISVRRFHLSHVETEEVCQRVWIQLAKRMRSYQYDPSKSFRGWLRTLVESRALDLIRERKLHRTESFAAEPSFDPNPPESEDSQDVDRPRLLIEAERVQAVVRGKVSEKTWSAFWLTAIEGQSVLEAAATLGMTYAAAFVAQKRVKDRLREEGERGLERLG